MIQKTKVKKAFNTTGVQISSSALAMMNDHIAREIQKYANRCKSGNVKRLTPELFYVALGNYEMK
jgi:fructose-1-phosphate kinase PfkB-like protein